MFRRLVLAGAGTALIAAAFTFAMTASQWTTANAAITNCSTSGQPIDGAEQQLLTLINGFRTANGRAALKPSPNLSRAAAWMSSDQSSNGTFSHTDSLGRSPFVRVQNCGYGSQGAGENLALTSSAQSAFNLWVNSTAGHRENMLNANWKVVGVGRAGNVWTADFGALDDSSEPWDSGASNTPTTPPTASSTTPANTSTSPANGSTSVANTPLPTSTPKPAAPLVPLKRAVLPLVSTE